MVAIGTAGEAVVALAAFIVIVGVPGAALTLLLWPERELDWAVLAGVGVSIGTGMTAVLAAWMRVAHLAWLGTAFAYGYGAAWLAGFIFLLVRGRPTRLSLRLTAPGMLLVVVLSLAFYARMAAVRDLAFGQLGDSLHHSVITGLLIENGGLFNDWAPYGPMTTLTYHFGFHMVAAMFQLTTGIALERSVVLVGQLFNVATVLVAYGSSRLIFRRALSLESDAEWAALFAALVPAFLNTQPAYYVNWGRYTQLAGQVILPTLGALILVCTRDAARPQPDRRGLALLGLAVAGVLVTHYRVALFAVAIAAASLALLFVESRRLAPVFKWAVAIGLAFAAGALLAAPWLYATTAGKLPSLYGGIVLSAIGAQAGAPSGNLPAIAPFYVKSWLALVAMAATLLAARQRAWSILHAAAWASATLAFPMLYLLALPGSGVIDSFASYLALYIPASVLFGYACARALRWSRACLPGLSRAFSAAAAVLVLGLSAWGVSFQRDFLDRSQGAMVSAADAEAFAWIRANTPPDARFFVSGFPCFGAIVCGNDAGWWLGFEAKRQTSLPPILYATEQTDPPEFRLDLQALYSKIRGKTTRDAGAVLINLADPVVLSELRADGYGYVFVGNIRFPSNSDAFDVERMLASKDLELVFAKEGSRVFRLR